MRYPSGMSREEYFQHLQDTEDDIAYMQRDNAYNARYESQAYYRDPEPTYEMVTPDDFATTDRVSSSDTEETDGEE